MNQSLDLHAYQRSRAVAAADILAMALERGAHHMALAAAQEAARAALLALAGAPCRMGGADREILTQMAAWPPQHLAGQPAERQARMRAALAILDRLFPRPPPCERRISSEGTQSPASERTRGTARHGGATVILGPDGRPNTGHPSSGPWHQEGARR